MLSSYSTRLWSHSRNIRVRIAVPVSVCIHIYISTLEMTSTVHIFLFLLFTLNFEIHSKCTLAHLDFNRHRQRIWSGYDNFVFLCKTFVFFFQLQLALCTSRLHMMQKIKVNIELFRLNTFLMNRFDANMWNLIQIVSYMCVIFFSAFIHRSFQIVSNSTSQKSLYTFFINLASGKVSKINFDTNLYGRIKWSILLLRKVFFGQFMKSVKPSSHFSRVYGIYYWTAATTIAQQP